MTWDDLEFWKSKHWEQVQDYLDSYDKDKIAYNPARENIFKALDLVDLEDVRVCVIGQDPYPNPNHATGVAFSIPSGIKEHEYPPTITNIFKGYMHDLSYPKPTTGNLEAWSKQGVLLWNCTPTCLSNKPMSHKNWEEWHSLTKEIVEVLQERCIVFILLGVRARSYSTYINLSNSDVIETSHPSPLGNVKGKIPFVTARVFSTCNGYLVKQGLAAVDWKLP